jgi:hypothetical protein
MSEKYNYTSLSNLDETRKSDKENFAKQVRLILKEFLFKELKESIYFDSESLELTLIRHSIINFLYCGKFTLQCKDPIIYNDKAQKELAQVSSTANEIRHTLSKISIINEKLIEHPTDEKLKGEVIKLEKQLGKFENKLKAEKGLISEIVKIQEEIDSLSILKLSKEESRKLSELKTKINKLSESIKDSPEEFFNKIETSWKHVTKHYDNYIVKLNEQLINGDSKIDKIIVYEAPPYLGNKKVDDTYFLTSNDKTYSSPIRECFDSKEENKELSMIEFLAKYKIGFFDLSMACLPLSDGDIRKNWNKKPEFNIGDKQLTVILFELSLEHFIEKINFQIVKHPLFAIGTPVNTSAGIFEHYSQKLLKVYCDNSNSIYFDNKKSDTDQDILLVDLGVTNTTSTFMKRNEKGTTFPLFKSNIISSGYPNHVLMKNAFNIDVNIDEN